MRHEALAGMTEQEIDALHDELRDVSGKLHIPTIEAVISVNLIKPHGEKIEQFKRHSRSFTRNLYVHHAWRLSWWSYDNTWADGKLTLRKYSGATVGNMSGPPYVYASNMKTGYSFKYYGHLVGSDNTTEDFSDYTLGAEIAHGTGAGELSRAACNFHSEAWNAGGSYYYGTWTRNFTNGSGSPIDVYEFCTVWRSRDTLADIMWSRDVEAGGVTVPNGDILNVAYEHRISYP